MTVSPTARWRRPVGRWSGRCRSAYQLAGRLRPSRAVMPAVVVGQEMLSLSHVPNRPFASLFVPPSPRIGSSVALDDDIGATISQVSGAHDAELLPPPQPPPRQPIRSSLRPPLHVALHVLPHNRAQPRPHGGRAL